MCTENYCCTVFYSLEIFVWAKWSFVARDRTKWSLVLLLKDLFKERRGKWEREWLLNLWCCHLLWLCTGKVLMRIWRLIDDLSLCLQNFVISPPLSGKVVLVCVFFCFCACCNKITRSIVHVSQRRAKEKGHILWFSNSREFWGLENDITKEAPRWISGRFSFWKNLVSDWYF